MSFDEVAKKVVKNSIRSAVCIDDEYPSAYQENKDLKKEEASKLYNSFRDIGSCDLDIYNFESLQRSWKKEYMIPNKDLIILDWELSKSTVEAKYKDTLSILSDIIESEQIPFVVIYTHTEDINKVSRILIEEFSLIVETVENLTLALQDKLNQCEPQEDFEIEGVIEDESFLKLFYQYVHNFSKRGEIKEEILNLIKDNLHLNSTTKIIDRKLKQALSPSFETEKDYLKSLSFLCLAINGHGTKRHHIERVESKYDMYKIGTTNILICRKIQQTDGIDPNELFNMFSDAIISNPHNYLSLLALELKDQIRTEFSKIGARFAQIDELAFFYHMKNYWDKDEKSFNLEKIDDFVLKSWLEDFNSFRFDAKSLVISRIEEAYNLIKEKIPSQLNEEIINSLVKYSALLSTNNDKKERKELRFGDIFYCKETSDNYYMCITPHCDCVRPKKIDYNFYFIKGGVAKNSSAVKNAETGHYSFLNYNNYLVSIEWEPRPFTVHIIKNDINAIEFKYSGVDKKPIFCTSQKENFTQRISNEAFGYGYRVGIDLPHEIPRN